LLAATDAKARGDYSIIMRDDGTKQWAYKGKPLYLWIKDSKPGDRTGDGFNNAWRLARS
jgi:predicted lipoprotein with Yx(FWY)xxD motif